MSFGKEIYTLLLQHDVVIIPGLGAFISEYNPAEISDESDEIKPPSKSISFNPQLKNNDGLLVGHIAEKLHISHFNALVRIEKERDEMLFKLDKGDDVFVEGVGTLSYNEQGKIVFQATTEENMLLDSFGLESMSMSEPEPPEPSVASVASVASVDEDFTKDEPEENIPVVTEAEKKDEEQTADEQPVMNKPEIEKKERKKKPWLLLLIIIPLLAVSAFIFLKDFNNEVDKEKLNNTTIAKELPAEHEVAATDSVLSDSVATSTGDTTVVSDTTQTVTEPLEPSPQRQDSVRYYLVGGSFSVIENADNYLLELQKKGYKAFHVGKKGRFFIVGIGSYKSFSEAEAAKKEYLDDNPGSEVWVYRR